MPILVMLCIILVNVVCMLRKKYVNWNRKAPAIRCFLVPVITYVFYCSFVRFLDLQDYAYIISQLFSMLMWILMIRGFIVYIVRYNKMYRSVKQELQLDKEHTLYNASIVVVNIIVLFLLWVITGGILDKVVTVNSVTKYNSELSFYSEEDNQFGFFPENIPNDATNITFYSKRGMWIASSKVYVSFVVPEDYISGIEAKYTDEVTQLDCKEDNPSATQTKEGICTYTFRDYVGNSNCDIYLKISDSAYGYAINRSDNQICFFYDGEN